MNKKAFKRTRPLTNPNQVQELVDLIDKYGLTPITIGKGGDYPTTNAYMVRGDHTNYSDVILFEQTETELHITTKYYSEDFKVTTYVLNLNLEEETTVSGHRVYSIFCKYYQVPNAKDYHCEELDWWWLKEQGKYACSAGPYVDYERKFSNKEYETIYEYDLNSAYASTLMEKIPDFYHPKFKGVVRKGEVGFLIDDKLTLIDVEGLYADVVFPLIDTPEGLKKYLRLYYGKKQHSSGIEKQKAKEMLNVFIGYMQRINPFFRAYVVHNCNRKIKGLLDSNSTNWNTDAIFSTTKRTDLPIGNEIGQFKEVVLHNFRLKGNNYQADNEDPKVRGIVKHYYERFKKRTGRVFNLLEDKLTDEDRRCLYHFNFKTLKLERT